jgi:hypothetical protein
MNKSLYATAVALALAAAAAGSHLAYANPHRDPGKDYPRTGASADPSAGPSARPPEPAPAVADSAKPWVPSFEAPFPDESPSTAPSSEEWAHAAPAAEVRITDTGCTAQRIREWYRIDCQSAVWIELISGERRGISFGCHKTTRESTACDKSWVIFPARRGDRRSLEVFTWSKWGPSPDVMVTEQFLEGDTHPWVTVHGHHWGF